MGPFETFSVMLVPSATEAPAFGDWEITWPCGLAESTVTCRPLSFASCRSDKARAICSPTTLGTAVFGGPVDT